MEVTYCIVSKPNQIVEQFFLDFDLFNLDSV